MSMQRAFKSLAFLAIVVVGGGVASAGPHMPPTGPTLQPTTMAPPPSGPAPKVIGWPHSVLSGDPRSCARNPFPLEVIVYENPNFTGSCAILQPGFYPHPFQLFMKNDAISSIKVGQLVRARAFKDNEYGGAFTVYGASSSTAQLTSDWNDAISSMRVEMASRSVTCDDVGEGEIGLYRDENFFGDCVVLPGDGAESFATAAQMGIANDSISSIWNNTGKELVAFDATSFASVHGTEVAPHAKVAELSKGSFGISGMNDCISSVMLRSLYH